jgi:hypothetical protein
LHEERRKMTQATTTAVPPQAFRDGFEAAEQVGCIESPPTGGAAAEVARNDFRRTSPPSCIPNDRLMDHLCPLPSQNPQDHKNLYELMAEYDRVDDGEPDRKYVIARTILDSANEHIGAVKACMLPMVSQLGP